MAKQNAIFFDGNQKVSLSSIHPGHPTWEAIMSGSNNGQNLQVLRRKVPWLFRGIEIRKHAVSSIPFSIYKGNVEVDNTDDWQNVLGWMPDPKMLFRKSAGALAMFGYAYFYRVYNAMNRTLEVRYLQPTSVAPVIDPSKGLVEFKRRTAGGEKRFPVEDIVYFWNDDEFVELGPPNISPAIAALAAAGVLFSSDEFARIFFDRGAIKATILGVPASTQPDQKEELESWFTRVINGLGNAFSAKVINADAVIPTVIGEGLEGLSNSSLSKEKREDVSTALGIPQTTMFSQAANYATAKEDTRMLYELTAVPDFEFLASVWNTQVLVHTGHRIVPRPNALDAFQEDETKRSGAFVNYRQGGIWPSVASKMLGLDLPEGMEAEELDTMMLEARQMAVAEVPAVGRGAEPIPDKSILAAKENERRQFKNYLRKGRDPALFEFNILDEFEQFQLLKELPSPAPNPAPAGPDPDALVKAVTGVIDELRSVKVPDIVNVYNQVAPAPVQVDVDVPAAKAPVVKMSPAPVVNVNVDPTPVQVDVAAPAVTVENEVVIPEPKKRKTKVKRNAKGEVTDMETE